MNLLTYIFIRELSQHIETWNLSGWYCRTQFLRQRGNQPSPGERAVG